MSNICVVLDSFFLVIWSNNFFSWNSLFLFSLLILIVALVIQYLLVAKYKKRLIFEEDDKENRIGSLKKMLGNKDTEINSLRLKLKNGETRWNDWDEEKEKLNRKIKNLEGRIVQYSKNDNLAKDDLVIEYYMNKKSVDKD
jgi:hypothetical protein